MNITYLVGNGFDLSLGLKTSYTNFIEWYVGDYKDDGEKGSEDEVKDLQDFKKRIIARDKDTWGDAELAFGKNMSYFSPEKIDIFKECVNDFELSLSSYLTKQADDAGVNFDDTRKLLTSRVEKFYNRLREESREALNNILTERLNERRIYNFISFNYTATFDYAIDALGGEKHEFTSHMGKYGRIMDSVGNVIHIHGTTEAEMVFGVDNALQINNEMLRDNDVVKRMLIKPETNKRLKTGNAKKAKACINESDVIIIHGMSLGETDSTWWKLIGSWLNTNTKRQLVLSVYDKDYNIALASKFFDAEEKYENRFFSYSSFDSKTKNELRNKIHVVINENMLPIRLIKK